MLFVGENTPKAVKNIIQKLLQCFVAVSVSWKVPVFNAIFFFFFWGGGGWTVLHFALIACNGMIIRRIFLPPFVPTWLRRGGRSKEKRACHLMLFHLNEAKLPQKRGSDDPPGHIWKRNSCTQYYLPMLLATRLKRRQLNEDLENTHFGPKIADFTNFMLSRLGGNPIHEALQLLMCFIWSLLM